MILGVLQARVSSSRLPGKVLKPILGKPMLSRQIERLQRARSMDRLVLATSVEAEDDALVGLARDAGIECFRGSLNDVLERFYQAAQSHAPDHVVRLTGDCPLADPELIDQIVDYHLKGRYDYSSNSVQATFPDGLDVEVTTFGALERAWREAHLPSHREHVTLFIHSQPQHFKVGHFKQAVDQSKLRWTVDEPEDFEMVRQIYESLYPKKANFSTTDIMKLLMDRPELADMNLKFERNEGLAKSLLKDGGQ
jgi:spore coat polysaccharide biosynthesis protein SpsF